MHTFFFLLVGHSVCDYPLQGDFLAKGKNHKSPIPGIPFYQCLFWHSMIQAGAVALVTGSLKLGIAELICHICIDFSKCQLPTKFSFNLDQLLHVICKGLWCYIG